MSESPRHPAGAPETGITRITINQETRVGWFDIRQLFFTGVKVLTSTIVNSMSGRREIMAALDLQSSQSVPLDYSQKDDIWIDYIADTGDGGIPPLPLPISSVAIAFGCVRTESRAHSRFLQRKPKPNQAPINGIRWNFRRGQFSFSAAIKSIRSLPPMVTNFA